MAFTWNQAPQTPRSVDPPYPDGTRVILSRQAEVFNAVNRPFRPDIYDMLDRIALPRYTKVVIKATRPSQPTTGAPPPILSARTATYKLKFTSTTSIKWELVESAAPGLKIKHLDLTPEDGDIRNEAYDKGRIVILGCDLKYNTKAKEGKPSEEKILKVNAKIQIYGGAKTLGKLTNVTPGVPLSPGKLKLVCYTKFMVVKTVTENLEWESETYVAHGDLVVDS